MAPIRVLLADDTAQLRGLIRTKLTRTGRFDVVAEAENGQEALDAAGRTHPDVVVLDLSMPVMDGMKALPRLRRCLPDAVIVVFSGFENASVHELVMTRGANGYLEKGQPLDRLIGMIYGLLGVEGADTSPGRHAGAPCAADRPAAGGGRHAADRPA